MQSARLRKPPQVQRLTDELEGPIYVLLYFPIDRTYNIFPSNSHFLPSDGTAVTAPLRTQIVVKCGTSTFQATICARGEQSKFPEICRIKKRTFNVNIM